MKNILILCTGNSCRSIMGEMLINHYLGDKGVKAYSSGVKPSGKVNLEAIKALNEAGINTDGASSKTMDTLKDIEFDLVITVCDHANETCPIFNGKTKVIHCGFEDPSGKEYIEYTKTRDLIKEILLPIVEKECF